MLVKEAKAAIGSLSEPSKMPGYSYGIPAKECKVGSKLRGKKGSVCSTCYAERNNYTWENVQAAQYKRLALVKQSQTDETHWVASMAFLINRYLDLKGVDVFRWFDSGDLQGLWHLEMVVEVCLKTPKVKHWLPSREYRMIREYLKKHGSFPKNLVVRYSAHWKNKMPDTTIEGLPFSTVSTSDDVFPDAHHCPSRHQNNECGNCRACWDEKVKHVDYHNH